MFATNVLSYLALALAGLSAVAAQDQRSVNMSEYCLSKGRGDARHGDSWDSWTCGDGQGINVGDVCYTQWPFHHRAVRIGDGWAD